MKRILIIENDEELLEEISEILINEGFDVAFAVNGEEGLKEIRRNHPYLILCDIMMPGMDGYEVLQKLHETGEEVIPPLSLLQPCPIVNSFVRVWSLARMIT